MRVLLAEDDELLGAGLRAGLHQQGFVVDWVRDGVAAERELQTGRYHASVLDLGLPRQGGMQALTAVRARKVSTPVLVLTARDGVKDRVRGLDAGADDYLVKPFDIDELLARVRALIRRTSNQADSRLQIGDVVVDTAARTVARQGEAVALTAREYALVEFLAVHRGKVISRTALYDHLFDENDASLSNLLDVHVSNIRRKLGHDFIATRRGHGYCIEGDAG